MNQLQLFDDSLTAPPTEGIKYAGSKRRLIPFILKIAQNTGARTVLDDFSGTTRVSQAFAQRGYKVHSNDIAVWSEVFGTCYLKHGKSEGHYQALLDHLNAMPPRSGWFTEHYGGLPNGGCSVQSDGLKRPWQIKNTRRLDAIREEIDELRLDADDKAVALTSLILALDRVDSSIGHFASYLRNWSPRSYQDLTLRLPRLFSIAGEHHVYRRDIFDLLPTQQADLAYYDPPYGSNNEKMPPSRVRYAAYYHIWKTIVLADVPALFGKAMRRQDTSDQVATSPFEEFRRNPDGRFIAIAAIDRLIRATRANHILLSYGSGGRATAAELDDVMRCHGKLVEVVELDHARNVMASMTRTNEWLQEAERPNREFLLLLEKSA